MLSLELENLKQSRFDVGWGWGGVAWGDGELYEGSQHSMCFTRSTTTYSDLNLN